VTTSRYAVGEQLRSGNTWRSVAQRQSVCSGRIQQEGEKCRGCATLFADRILYAKFLVSHRERRIFWTKKRTTWLRAKSLLSLQSIVYKATSSILQVSRADGRSHRRSEVDRWRRPDFQVRRCGPVVCAVKRLLDCYSHCNLDCIRAVSDCRSNYKSLS